MCECRKDCGYKRVSERGSKRIKPWLSEIYMHSERKTHRGITNLTRTKKRGVIREAPENLIIEGLKEERAMGQNAGKLRVIRTDSSQSRKEARVTLHPIIWGEKWEKGCRKSNS